MGKTVTCSVNKGGTGKTTLAVALAQYARREGLSVALVDNDVQGNATDHFVADRVVLDTSLHTSDLFTTTAFSKPVAFVRHPGKDVQPATIEKMLLVREEAKGFAIIAADEKLKGVERAPLEAAQLFGTNLRRLAGYFDLVVVDTPPTLGFGMLAPLMGSDYVFAPITPDSHSARGVTSLYANIKDVQESYNPNLQFLGMLVNRAIGGNPTHRRIIAEQRKQLGDSVLPHVIGERAAIYRTQLTKKPVWVGASSGSDRTASKEMRQAMSHLMDRMGVSLQEVA